MLFYLLLKDELRYFPAHCFVYTWNFLPFYHSQPVNNSFHFSFRTCGDWVSAASEPSLNWRECIHFSLSNIQHFVPWQLEGLGLVFSWWESCQLASALCLGSSLKNNVGIFSPDSACSVGLNASLRMSSLRELRSIIWLRSRNAHKRA